MGRTATYLYCVVDAPKAPSLAGVPRGLPQASPPAVRAAGRSLWLVTADVPLATYGEDALESALRDLEWVAEVAVAHENVVEHFTGQKGLTVVPAQLFTMFSSPERALAETRSRRRQIAAIVRRISGCEEWGVRVTRGPSAGRPAG